MNFEFVYVNKHSSHILQNSEHQKRQLAFSMCPERDLQKKSFTKELNETDSKGWMALCFSNISAMSYYLKNVFKLC